VALQSSEKESIPCITNTNGTVIRPNNKQLSGTLLCCGKTADSPRAVAFKDFKSFIVLYVEGDHSAICQSCIEDSPSTMEAENPVFQL